MVILSLICLVAGVMVAGRAPKRPAHQAALESLGGSLIVGGLCLLGVGLPLFR